MYKRQEVDQRIISKTLPDAVMTKLTQTNVYGPQGAFVDLAPYIEKYAPNLQKYIDDNPDYKALVTNEAVSYTHLGTGTGNCTVVDTNGRKRAVDYLEIRRFWGSGAFDGRGTAGETSFFGGRKKTCRINIRLQCRELSTAAGERWIRSEKLRKEDLKKPLYLRIRGWNRPVS